ncbi:might be a transmembrane protein [Purpureocillium lavendulum]|uniref:Might be a transmembrane protein n=1 Tax=Purpureocillium lavendulum TaxID=1247861 RepID=A0AB34FL56_9HYPO|nr:might be a transmembrane protein [Purpureocillium lavendulum]
MAMETGGAPLLSPDQTPRASRAATRSAENLRAGQRRSSTPPAALVVAASLVTSEAVEAAVVAERIATRGAESVTETETATATAIVTEIVIATGGRPEIFDPDALPWAEPARRHATFETETEMDRLPPTQTGLDAAPGTAVPPLQAPRPQIHSSDCRRLDAVEALCVVVGAEAAGVTGPPTEVAAALRTTNAEIVTLEVALKRGDGVEIETNGTVATDILLKLTRDVTLAMSGKEIPVGPRAQQSHPGSKQWVNPNLKKGPESPKMMRAQTFSQSGPASLRRGSSQIDQAEPSRPRSSDAKADTRSPGYEDRSRSHYSAEPGEIVKFEPEPRGYGDYRDRSAKSASAGNSPALQTLSKFPNGKIAEPEKQITQPVDAPKQRRRMPNIPVVRFAVPARQAPMPDHDSESDDDDMADYFDMEIQKTEAELSKLPKPSLPRGVVARYAAMSHGAMAELLSKSEGLTEMLGRIPDEVRLAETKPIEQSSAQPKPEDETVAPVSKEEEPATSDTLAKVPEPAEVSEAQSMAEAMDIDMPSTEAAPKEPEAPLAEAKPTEEVKRASVGPPAPATDVSAIPSEVARQSVPSETTGVGSKPPSTPSQIPDEDDDETESEDEAFVDIETVRRYMRTPPIDSLPDYYNGKDWSKDEDFLTTLDADPVIDNFVAKHLDKIHIQEREEQTKAQKAYEDNYVQYLHFTLSNDPIAVKSRDKFSVAAPVPEVPGTATPEPPKPEGRGGRRFASERDLERVLQASMREDEERKERELRAQKEKYRSDKEAVIPDMYWDAEQRAKAQYTDRSGYTPVERLVSAWQVLPPVNNFTAEEAELFEKAYLEFPKQWGRIADAVPNRDFRACIQYYYLMKKELNLKEKLKKQPRRRKKGGRGKQRSSALVSELGNGEQDGEETQDTGDNGERRRPRRAAAPTWGFEQPATDSENATPAGTPGRRGASAAARAEQGEKVDGRKGRRKAAKDKEGKGAKANQNLTATATPSSARGRSRSSSRVPPNTETPAPPPPTEPTRTPAPLEQPAAHAGIQPPFPVQPVQAVERPKPVAPSSISEVMAAPSLRPEPPPPPPQPSMTSFHLAQPQSERKTTTQASSYWSVSEANDFPHLLRAFGSDWTSIASHMGSKTAVMVKNYFVRQKDQGKPEWEGLVQEADAKRARGEKRPDPPQPTAGGRGRRFENTTTAPGASRPLAVAPGVDPQGEPSQAKMEAQPPQARPQAFPGYGVPIAQAPAQQPLAQPGPQTGQQQIAMQQHAAGAAPPPASQAMSPGARPLRAPLQPFGFPERDREPPPPAPQQQQQQQRVSLPQKTANPAVPELREQRPLAAAQPLQPAHPDAMMERQKLEMQQREREREREREAARQSERQTMRMTQEAELAAQRHYEPYGHRQQSSLGGGPREPLSLARPPSQEPSRSVAGQPYPPPMQQQGPHAVRAMMGEPGAAQSPPLGPAITSRPMSSLQQRQPPGPGAEPYGVAPQAPPPSRPPEPRKTSNIMSLLNDDPPPAAKRVSDVSTNAGHSATPPPQAMARPPPGPAPPSQMRREPETQYSPYGRAPSGGPGMPPLKPTYGGSPNPPPPMGSAGSERDYYRQHAYQPQPGHHSSGTNSPQTSQRYPPPGQPGQGQYPTQSGYPTAYGGGGQVPHAGSPPPPQYAVHQPAPRAREMVPGGRENAWPQQGHQQQPPPAMQQATGWPTQPPKSQAQPPQQSWPQHPSSTPKPSTPAPAWSAAPPPQQAHPMSMRDERSGPMYGGNAQPPQHRYGPPATRGPEPVPPPAQGYPRYVSTPGPVGPRDPREQARSYTPGVYDARGPPPPPGPGPGPAYPGPDPREMSLRDGRDPRDPRDPREMMARGLRPHEYERHPDNRYGR